VIVTENRSNSNGSSTYPTYPKMGFAKTARGVIGLDRIQVWAILFVVALFAGAALEKLDWTHRQIAAVKARLRSSEADRHEIHKEIRDLGE
jgi:hypothetical protein